MTSPRKKSRASIMIVVLVTIIVAATALLLFVEKASDDLLVESRSADARRLRGEALNSLETVLAVLQDFRTVNGGLKSPAEGWGEPLKWAGYEPSEGRTVSVEFKDESGKLSLPKITQPVLVNLFVSWNIQQADADRLADSILYWMKHEHVPTSGFTPTYELDTLACEPPGRSLRSIGELASIDVVRDFFFEDDGRPNAFWQRFVQSVSLLDFAQTNINGASADVLAANGYELSQQSRITEYLTGTGAYQATGAGFFKNTSDIAAIAGSEGSGATSGFGISIRALRIIITVREGKSSYRLNTVITFSGNAGAKTVDTKATSEKKPNANTDKTSTGTGGTRATTSSDVTTTVSGTSSTASASGQQSINYPFVILEMRENDEIAQPLPTSTSTP